MDKRISDLEGAKASIQSDYLNLENEKVILQSRFIFGYLYNNRGFTVEAFKIVRRGPNQDRIVK